MSAAVRSSERFLCSICLEVFTEPVSTPCGHNFCKTCITQHWDTSASCRCPLCNKRFDTRPELNVNTLFSEMVSQFRLERSSSMDRLMSLSDVSKPVFVSCDMCSDPKLKAVKSCLVCLTSFCDTHLQPHLTVSGLKRHQLMEPVDNLEDRMCPQHNKPLELFCRTDHNCVCTMCPLLDHKNHEFVSLKEEYEERKASLQQSVAENIELVKQRRLKVQQIQDSLELSQKAVDRETAVGLQVFTALMESVQRRQEKFIEELQEKQRQSQKQAQDLIQELEQEISELEKRSSEVEQLSSSEDHLHFIQRSTSLRPAAVLKDWNMLSFEKETFEGSAARAVSELEKSLTDEFKKVFKTELKRVQQFAVDVTLDPDTAHPELVLSEDLKQVHDTDVWKDLPDTPQRFDKCACVLGKQDFSSGRFYFEVQVKGKTDWDLGVAQESIDRKGTIYTGPKNGFWSIILRNSDEYSACTDSPVRLSPRCPPQKVGVFVDYSEGVVSFYDVDTADLIYSFTGCCFKNKLLPYFSPGLNNNDTNSSPLVITPVRVWSSLSLVQSESESEDMESYVVEVFLELSD